jgi:CRISPR/Cas system CSM-associated protein Csm3 (group 7 of RAMP superfamily)
MNNHLGGISDPGCVRPVAARWVVTADFVLDSAAHFGGAGEGVADMVLLRDDREGRPLLPGTSLAGALRGHLGDVLDGYASKEDGRVARLFGGARSDDLGGQSPLIVFDSLGSLPTQHPVEIRDGVQIVTAFGTAEEHKKFDMEVLPAGTRFPLRFDLIVPDPASEAELASLLAVSLAGLAPGEISLGARRSRGMGAIRTENWRALRFDLNGANGWLAWVLSDPEHPIPPDTPAASSAILALRNALHELELPKIVDQRRRILIQAHLNLQGGLLVRSTSADPQAPDVAHLRSAGRSIMPGTSLAGVLRARALRITRLVRGAHDDAEQWAERRIEQLFGPRIEGVAGSQDRLLWASRLRITESVIEDGTRFRPSRLQIDRFTQGVVPGALFDEEPEYAGKVTVRFELRNPEPGDVGLLFLLLKDLLSGDLPVGGTSSVGRGVLRGTAAASLEDGTELQLDLEAPGPRQLALINQKIEEFAASAGTRKTP